MLGEAWGSHKQREEEVLKSRDEIYKLGKFSELFLDKLTKSMDGLPTKDVGQRISNLLFGEGEEPPSPPVDPRTRYLFDNFYYYLEIIHCFERLYQAYGYLQKFPRLRYYNFYQINELNWIRYHIEFLFQQNYIMHQRTVRWIRYLLNRAKHMPNKKATELKLVKLKNTVDKGFAQINRVRGRHVHEFTYEERAFERAETAAYFASIMKKMKGLMVVKNLTLFEISVEWRKKAHDNIMSLIKFYDLMLGALVKVINDLE
jgi:hypothetical protein